MRSHNFIRMIGPSIGLGALKKDLNPRQMSKGPCKIKHRWKGNSTVRSCCRCGREEAFNIRTQEWEF